MPPAKRDSRCMYVERNRRCTRNGYPFCATHMIVMQDASRAPSTDGTMEELAKMLTGRRKLDVRTLTATALGVFAGVAAAAAARELGGQPGMPFPFPFPHGGNPPRAERPRQAPPPPPPGPAAPDRRALAAARVTLGFQPADVLTADVIKKRRRTLARKYHPDATGGSPEKMASVNAAADLLLEEIG